VIIDTSAIIAVLTKEPECRFFIEAIESADTRKMSTASFVETSIVLEARYGSDGIRDFDLFIAKANITLVPVDAIQAQIARRAYKQYGKGRHKAGLNFGDCFAYALAKNMGDILLFKGEDFSKTDIAFVIEERAKTS